MMKIENVNIRREHQIEILRTSEIYIYYIFTYTTYTNRHIESRP